MTHQEYSLLPGLTASELITFAESPKLYEWLYILGHEKKSTDAMSVSDACHRSVLEPDVFDQVYVKNANTTSKQQTMLCDLVAHDCHIRRNEMSVDEMIDWYLSSVDRLEELGSLAGYAKSGALKAAKEQLEKENIVNRIKAQTKALEINATFYGLSDDDFEMALSFRERFRNNNTWQVFMGAGEQMVEHIVQATIPVTNEHGELVINQECKIRPDLLVVGPDRVIHVDLKFIYDIAVWKQSYVKYKYHLRTAFYDSVLSALYPDKIIENYIGFAEKKAPYDAFFYKIPIVELNACKERNNELMLDLFLQKQAGQFKNVIGETESMIYDRSVLNELGYLETDYSRQAPEIVQEDGLGF